MMLTILVSAILALNMTIFLNSSPVNMGIWILYLALSISMLLSLIMSSWFGLILFLMYISGMLVMFAYFAAISPNQILITRPYKYCLFAFFLSMWAMTHTTFPQFPISPLSTTTCTILLSKMNIPIYLFMGMTLFLTLIAVVKISFLQKGPLRPHSS